MIIKKAIDMTRPAALYLGLITLLLMAVFVEGRMGLVLVSRHPFHFQKTIAAVLILTSVAVGLIGASRYAARAQSPWRVPQVQVFLCFALFFLLGAAGVVFSS